LSGDKLESGKLSGGKLSGGKLSGGKLSGGKLLGGKLSGGKFSGDKLPLRPFGIFFTFWYVWNKKNLATLMFSVTSWFYCVGYVNTYVLYVCIYWQTTYYQK
jgi:hypothetical protein